MSKAINFKWDRIKPYGFYKYGKFAVAGMMRLMYDVDVHGRENIPERAGGVVLACNHLHAIDPIFLMTATLRNWRYIGKQELFQNKMVGFLYRHCNGFPINREVIDRRAIEFAIDVVKDGRCGLVIFPEGQRSPDGRPLKAKTGAAVIARRTKADILPCSLYHEGKLGFRTKMTVRIGKLIPHAELGLGDKPNQRQSRAATEKIMAAVTALWEQKHD